MDDSGNHVSTSGVYVNSNDLPLNESIFTLCNSYFISIEKRLLLPLNSHVMGVSGICESHYINVY